MTRQAPAAAATAGTPAAAASPRACMEASLLGLSREFFDAFSRVNLVNEALVHVRTTPMTLSTITFTGTLRPGGLDDGGLEAVLEDDGVLSTTSTDHRDSSSRLEDSSSRPAPPPLSLPVEEMRWNASFSEDLDSSSPEFVVDMPPAREDDDDARDRRFRYQLPLRRNGKSLKVFHNGSVHATGCGSPAEFLDMAEALRGYVREHTDESLEVELADFGTQLINVLFSVVGADDGRLRRVAPGALASRLLAQGVRVDFDTERHPSVKIPVFEGGRKVATACVFQTGNVYVLGARRPTHVAMAYETACALLDAHAPEVCEPSSRRPRTTTARHPMVLEQGYPLNVFLCCFPAASASSM